jgi:hypothetical protein
MCHISQVEKKKCKKFTKTLKNGANIFNIPLKINAKHHGMNE